MSESSSVLKQQPNRTHTAQLVLWGDVNSNNVDESALNDWWTNEHLPERLSINGFNRARRYYSREDSTNTTYYLTIYEVTNLQVLTSQDYMDKLNNPTPRTRQHIPTLASMNRAGCKVLYQEQSSDFRSCGPAVAGTVAMVSFYLPEEGDVESILEFVIDAFSYSNEIDKAIMACTVLQEDRAATEPGSSSQSYRGVNLNQNNDPRVRMILFLEFSTPLRPPFFTSRAALEPGLAQLRSQLSGPATLRIFDLMCCVSR